MNIDHISKDGNDFPKPKRAETPVGGFNSDPLPTEEIDPPLLVEYLTWREGVPYVNGVPASREDIDRSLRGE